MGGKKKTKWRKLPLEEFTKELPPETKKVPPEDVYQSDSAKDDSNITPSFIERPENMQNYAEPYEYIDGLWYPTSCVVYNPSELGMYSNYMMPVDTCYYYYTVPEVPQMQEYVPVPYQDYTTQMPKDTVYLLLPTQTLRPSQAVQSVIPEWPTRRRRRRYEGYADYAVIPEKSNSTRVEEKERYKKTGHINSRRNSDQPNNFRRNSNFCETNSLVNAEQSSFDFERYQGSSKLNEAKKSPVENMNFETGPVFLNKEMGSVSVEDNQMRKKSLEVCGIHSKSAIDKNVVERNSGDRFPNTHISEDELYLKTEPQKSKTEKKQKSLDEELFSDISLSSESKKNSSPNNTELKLNNEEYDNDRSKELDKTDSKGSSVPDELNQVPSHNSNNEANKETQLLSPLNEDVSQHLPMNNISRGSSKKETDTNERNSQSSLPDILSTLSKPTTTEKCQDTDDLPSSPPPDSSDLDKGKSSKPKSFISQTSYCQNLLSSEALQNEMEIELKQMKTLHSLQANQSIYKLAYDENVTDQSEADSRSPSPVDPESQVPSSLTSAEILIHEADSGSDAGSEDVELLPHRYESETFLNESKHVYVNKLSLAVELLRTQETLPYDDEFKRVVGENNFAKNIVPVHTGGKVNPGFVDDHCSPSVFSVTNNIEKKGTSMKMSTNEIMPQYQVKHSAHSSSDSAIFSDIGFDSLEEEDLCETAKEVQAPENEIQNNTEEIRAGYRRFGVQARHYFSPRAAFSLNPCFCCVIM